MKLKSIFYLLVLSIACLGLSAQCPGGGNGGSSGNNGFSGGTSTSSSSSYSVSSGSSVTNAGFNHINQSVASGQYQNAKLAYQSIAGSPYLNDKPINGTLVNLDGSLIENVPLQVDLYSHHVIATNEKGEEIVLDGRFYNEVILPFEGQDLVFKKTNPKNPSQFYEVLYNDGDMVFFKENNVKLKKGSYNGIVETESRFNKTKTKYYIKMGDEEVVNVRLKKKDIFEMFPDSELVAMKDYAKRKGIKFKDEGDYVAVFQGVNE